MDWNSQCPRCGRRSLTIYDTGMARCNRCFHTSSRFDRWLNHFGDWAFIAVVLFALGVAWGVLGF